MNETPPEVVSLIEHTFRMRRDDHGSRPMPEMC